MDFVKNLLSDNACNMDGTMTSRNPFTAIVDRLFDSAMMSGTDTGMTSGGVDQGMAAGSGIMFSDPSQQLSNHIGSGSVDENNMYMMNMNNHMGMGSGFDGTEMHMQQLIQQHQFMVMMQQQNAMMQQQQMQEQMQQQQEQQAYERELFAQSMDEQNDTMESPEYHQMNDGGGFEEEAHVDLSDSILGAINKDDLSLERLEDIWEQFQQQNGHQVENEGASKNGLDMAWASIQEKIVEQGLAQADSYKFAVQNQFLAAHQASSVVAQQNHQSMEDGELFEQGMRLFKEGNIPHAILAFEANAQSSVDHDESWRMLGMCHTENDMDKYAITCLRRALECDPYNLDALLALGTCYVNELNSSDALAILKEWVLHHPTFSYITPVIDEYSDGTLMDEVMQLILAAHKHDPEDVDVKVLLGVLYNVSQDYEQAAQLFRDALQVKPDDYTLYNKLGATLANSNGSMEAIPLYEQALKIRPSYARGLLNLGISHANLNQYEEAARSYVRAIQQNPEGKHMWGYLRVVFTCMEDLDSVELCGQENLEAIVSKLALQSRG